MQAIVVTIHIIACLLLIVLVLLQSGKEDMGVIFGGGSSSVFGSSGAGGFLVKLTAWIAAIFLVTSMGYNYVSGTKVLDESSIMLEGDGIITPVPADMPESKPEGVTFERDEKPGDTSAKEPAKGVTFEGTAPEPAKGAETSDAAEPAKGKAGE